MLLPSLDFELMYWRARRCLQRMRSAYRFQMSQARASMQLQYLTWFGCMPEQPQPEDTRAYRFLWAVVVIGLAGVLAIEAIGEEEFTYRVDAIAVAVKNFPNRHTASPTPKPIEAELDKARLIAGLKNSI